MIHIRPATPDDTALVYRFIRELADYERLAHQVEATEAMIGEALFGPEPKAFCSIAEWRGDAAGFALWFVSFSTFKGRHGVWLEDLFVRPTYRRLGVGGALLGHLARICVERGYGRFEWSVLDWNETAIKVYRGHGATLMDDWRICRIDGAAMETLAERAP